MMICFSHEIRKIALGNTHFHSKEGKKICRFLNLILNNYINILLTGRAYTRVCIDTNVFAFPLPLRLNKHFFIADFCDLMRRKLLFSNSAKRKA